MTGHHLHQRTQHLPRNQSPSPAESILLFLSSIIGLPSEQTYFLENIFLESWEDTPAFIFQILKYFWGFKHAKIFPGYNQNTPWGRKFKSKIYTYLPALLLFEFPCFIWCWTLEVDFPAFKFTTLTYAIGKDWNLGRPNNGLSLFKDMQ